MKLKALTYILPAAGILLLFGCDYVNQPTDVSPSNPGGGGVTIPRKVLVEDYTGQKCGNCPAAATKATQLQTMYPNNVIVLAVHAGFFAQPGAAPYTPDYRNQAGDDWDAFFGIGAAGNPNGMINRKDYPNGTHIKAYTTWPAETAPYMSLSADATLSITPSYNSSAKTLDVSVKTKFVHALSDNYKLSVVLMEDSITGTQKDYTQSPSDIPGYVFRHMLRAGINGSWGDAINTAPVAANDSVTKTYTSFAIDPSYNDHHLHVIAFLYNATTREVIQAEEVKIH